MCVCVCVCVCGMGFGDDVLPANLRVVTGKNVKKWGREESVFSVCAIFLQREWHVSPFPISGLFVLISRFAFYARVADI